MSQPTDLARLERSLDWGLRKELPSRELIRLLRPLVRATTVDSDSGWIARLQLSEQLLRADPSQREIWEAAQLAKRVTTAGTTSNHQLLGRAWGALGLALTLLEYDRAARHAYHRALAYDPGNAVCAHNLGHLEVVRFGALRAGLRWLQIAVAALPEEPEVHASLAHAYARAGETARARAILSRVVPSDERVNSLLATWAERPAP